LVHVVLLGEQPRRTARRAVALEPAHRLDLGAVPEIEESSLLGLDD
jgi:hypothetical protein